MWVVMGNWARAPGKEGDLSRGGRLPGEIGGEQWLAAMAARSSLAIFGSMLWRQVFLCFADSGGWFIMQLGLHLSIAS